MQRIINSILVILIVLSLSACGARRREALQATTIAATVQAGGGAAAPVSQQPASGATLFKDDFQDGSPDGWQTSGAWFVNQDGEVYTFGATGQGYAYVQKGGGWGNYLFHTKAFLTSGTLALNFRLTKNGRYLLSYQAQGLYLQKEIPGATPATLASAAAPALNAWHNLTIGLEGGHIQVYVDQQLLIDASDPSPLPQGTIGTGTPDGSQASIDDVLVTKLTGPLPAAQVVASAPSAPAPQAPSGPPLSDAPDAGGEVIEEFGPSGPAQVSFTVEGSERATIDPGQCATVEWLVQNALEVYYQNQAATMHGTEDVCPRDPGTYPYALSVVQFDGSTVQREVILTATGEGGSIGGGEQADLAVTNVTLSNNRPATNENVTVSATIANRGPGAARNFRWTVIPFYESGGANNTLGGETIPQLNSGDDIQVQTVVVYRNTGTFTLRVVADASNTINDPVLGNSTYDVTVNVGGGELGDGDQVDLAITNVTPSTMTPRANEEFNVSATILNRGPGTAHFFKWGIYLIDANNVNVASFNQTINVLAPGDDTIYTIRHVSYGTPGTYTLRAVPDFDYTLDPAHDDYQDIQISISQQGSIGIDLAFGMYGATGEPKVGAPQNLVITIYNIGTQNAGSFTVRFYPDQNSNIVGYSWDIASLGHSEGKQLTGIYPGYLQSGEYTCVFIIDEDNEVHETDEDNNYKSTTNYIGP